MWLVQGLIAIFKYIEPLWLGNNKKLSIRKVLAIWLTQDLIGNISFAIRHFEIGKSLADVAMLVGIEAGLIAGMLVLTTYSSTNMFNKTLESQEQETINPE